MLKQALNLGCCTQKGLTQYTMYVGQHCGVIARKRILLFHPPLLVQSTLSYNDLIVTLQRKGKVENQGKLLLAPQGALIGLDF